ncbi:MAG TPA: cyclophilin-like fold protein, partial [Burkholderiaceae bacterium]|nr:cyclophilin-like fold protein [Burkholderiaceae bacterium]
MRTLLFIVAWVMAFTTAAHAQRTNTMKIRLTIDGKAIAATLTDNPAARAFAAQLPLTLDM